MVRFKFMVVFIPCEYFTKIYEITLEVLKMEHVNWIKGYKLQAQLNRFYMFGLVVCFFYPCRKKLAKFTFVIQIIFC